MLYKKDKKFCCDMRESQAEDAALLKKHTAFFGRHRDIISIAIFCYRPGAAISVSSVLPKPSAPIGTMSPPPA
jgi:hypothetical protein